MFFLKLVLYTSFNLLVGDSSLFSLRIELADSYKYFAHNILCRYIYIGILNNLDAFIALGADFSTSAD